MAAVIARSSFVGVLAMVLFVAGGDQAVGIQKPVTVPDTGWYSVGLAKMVNIEIPNGSYPCEGLMAFGPLAEDGTGPFMVGLEIAGFGDVRFEGTYTLPKPGKPVLVLDVAKIQEDLGPDRPLQKAAVKVKLKHQNEVNWIRLTFDARFKDCRVPTLGAAPACPSCRLTYKGDGIQADL